MKIHSGVDLHRVWVARDHLHPAVLVRNVDVKNNFVVRIRKHFRNCREICQTPNFCDEKLWRILSSWGRLMRLFRRSSNFCGKKICRKSHFYRRWMRLFRRSSCLFFYSFRKQQNRWKFYLLAFVFNKWTDKKWIPIS